MNRRSNERVVVQGSRPLPVTMPWASREALVERLRQNESAADLVKCFEAVGTSRPVTFTPEQKPRLRDAIEAWGDEQEQRYWTRLPVGVFELRGLLIDDIDDAQ